MLSEFQRLFEYDHWANREAWSSVEAIDPPPANSLRYLAHVAAAQQLWLSRIRRHQPTIQVWPTLSLAECAETFDAVRDGWAAFFTSLAPEHLAERIEYTNSKGERWSSTIEEILQHVILHSAYHRGQIATDVRASGHTPAYTDFIQWARTRSRAVRPEAVKREGA